MDAATLSAIAKAAKEAPQVAITPVVVAGRTLHADGDYFAYSCAGSDECPPHIARDAVKGRLFNAQTAAGAENVIIHLSASDTTKGDRIALATVKPYQGQREGSRRPKNWRYLRDYLEALPNVVISSHREADDSIAEAAHSNPSGTAIYTADKDMRMLPGMHVDWKTYQIHWVQPGDYDSRRLDGLQYGTKWFWLQMLHGDTADNIPGLPKCTINGKQKLCGEATAGKLLAFCTDNLTAYQTVADQYRELYGDEWAIMFCEQAMLLWLRQTKNANLDDFLEGLGLLHKTPLVHACIAINERVKALKHAAKAIGSETNTTGHTELTEW